jgi:hypothetical protein
VKGASVRFTGVGILLFFISACNAPTTQPPWEYMPNMAHGPSVRAFEKTMRVPPAGTFPIGYSPYPYTKDEGDLAGAQLTNPLPLNKETCFEGKRFSTLTASFAMGNGGKGMDILFLSFPGRPLSNRIR